jgi:hypothetical protein
MTDDIHLMLGAYVLGGLSSEDRRRFDEHLPGCDRCRHELAEAAPLPALLQRVGSVPSIPQVRVHDSSLDALLTSLRGRRRQQRTSRWLAATAAAAACVALGAGATGLLRDDGQPGEHGQAIAMVAPAGHDASGRVTVTKKPWGTAIALRFSGLPPTGTFTLQVTDDHGHAEPAATWSATPTGECAVNGATSIPIGHLGDLSIVGPNDSVVATAHA